MKKYIFTNDSWWDNPACSCCDPYLFEVYNSESTNCNLGSAYSRAHCYLQAIATELGYEFWEDVPDSYREMGHTELKVMADNMKIKVKVIS